MRIIRLKDEAQGDLSLHEIETKEKIEKEKENELRSWQTRWIHEKNVKNCERKRDLKAHGHVEETLRRNWIQLKWSRMPYISIGSSRLGQLKLKGFGPRPPLQKRLTKKKS